MRRLVHAAILATILSATGCVTPQKQAEPAKVVKVVHETLYDNIVIEVQAIKGAEPTRNTFTIFSELLEEYRICKKENVLIVYKYPIKNYKIVKWRNHAVRVFENLFRAISDKNPLDRNFTIFVAYLPGSYGEPKMQTVVGLKYNWSSIAVFGNHSGKSGANLLLHEFGHLIGMVNRKDREDSPINPDRPNHCNNSNCVMFWRWNRRGGLCELCERDILKILRIKNKNALGPF